MTRCDHNLCGNMTPNCGVSSALHSLDALAINRYIPDSPGHEDSQLSLHSYQGPTMHPLSQKASCTLSLGLQVGKGNPDVPSDREETYSQLSPPPQFPQHHLQTLPFPPGLGWHPPVPGMEEKE